MLKQNLEKVFNEIKDGNNLNEPITLVGAGKFIDVATLQQAVDLGLKIIGDNKVQEFRDKTSLVKNVSYHFIGRLQKNKVKYLVGKVDLIHSVDSVALGEEISRLSVKNNVVTNVLLEVNLGEESKTGFDLDKTYDAVKTISALPNVKVLGLMSMLPNIDDNDVLSKLCLQIRSLYDIIKNDGYDFKYLSLGMSGDYKIAIQNGSNMIRLGSCLFGARNYQ